MRLLIVEDEKMTRDGMLVMFDWKKMGFDSVQTAENGEKGLQVAQRYNPDVLVTDIRMPRMDGIEMARHIRKTRPQCRIIFLSAYSDKAYLKAAIQLKAVNYIEKPVEEQEFRKVLEVAIKEHEDLLDNEESARIIHQKELENIAANLISNVKDPSYKIRLKHLIGYPFTKRKVHVRTIIVNMKTENSEILVAPWDQVKKAFDDLAETAKIPYISTVKNNHCLLLHLFSSRSISKVTIDSVSQCLNKSIEPDYMYHIIVGKDVVDVQNLYHSYHSAVILMQKAFYMQYGSVLIHEHHDSDHNFNSDSHLPLKDEIIRHIGDFKVNEAKDKLKVLYDMLMSDKSALVAKIKEIYYVFLFETDRLARMHHVQLDNGIESNPIWVDKVDSYNLEELHIYLMNRLERLQEETEKAKDEKSQIMLIKDYIKEHYGDCSLSVKEISEYAHFSNSHLCTLFKKETGSTVNQYITDLRINMAKKLLKESKYTVAEVGYMVGYRDNSYFGRLFRKLENMTPAAYRES